MKHTLKCDYYFVTDAQMNPMALMMMKGGGGFFGKFLNNPYTLCKMTENVKAVPCRVMPQMCMIQSMKTYKLPNLMKCSPMGVGCCLKDARSLAMAKVFSRR